MASLLAGLTVVELVIQTLQARRLYTEARLRLHPFVQVTPSSAGLDGIDPQGFRGEPVAPARAARSCRIVALGGSTTLGIRNGFEDTYPRLLQQMLRARYREGLIEVVDSGVDWHTTAQALINYQLRVREYDPDLVASRHGAPFFDLEAAVPKTLEYFSDDVHMRREANVVLATKLFDYIEANHLVEARLSAPPR